jgi:hypothetical protein
MESDETLSDDEMTTGGGSLGEDVADADADDTDADADDTDADADADDPS